MIRIRARDKFVVVKEAPWRVFDQFEFFVYPTSIILTKNFLECVLNFIFGEVPNINDNDQLEEEKNKNDTDSE